MRFFFGEPRLVVLVYFPEHGGQVSSSSSLCHLLLPAGLLPKTVSGSASAAFWGAPITLMEPDQQKRHQPPPRRGPPFAGSGVLKRRHEVIRYRQDALFVTLSNNVLKCGSILQ